MFDLSSVPTPEHGSSDRRCPACGAYQIEVLADLADVPIWPTDLYIRREDALRSPVGRILLASCHACCHTYNVVSDGASIVRSAAAADESDAFRAYTSGLVQRLVGEYRLADAHGVEIGRPTEGLFASSCRSAVTLGTLFDPSHGPMVDPSVVHPAADPLWDDRAEFFVVRNLLERLPDPEAFLVNLRMACGGRTVHGYIEVPD